MSADDTVDRITAATDDTLAADDVDRSAAEHEHEHALGRGDQVGRYLLLDPLGQGAMGRVFRAYDPDLDRQVALKILLRHAEDDAEHRDRLLREAKAMARIDHPNVVRVHDAGVHEGSVFIAMEIIDGPSLDRWLLLPRTRVEILDVLTDAARGLAAAHAAGVVHRDFKPANVLVTPAGRAKVGDLGLAELDETTHSGHAMGTPAYMSPEHVAGVGIDARSDQFSFAITMYEALHGARPFSATTWPELASQIVTGQTTPALATRRRGIDGVLRRALSVEPTQRFASMDELIAAIERARRPVWRRVAAVGAVALVVGLAALAQRDPAVPCEPGARQVQAVWGVPAKAALQIGGRDYTPAFAAHARGRFEEALDDYAARWASAYDESCAAVGPSAQRGTPAQKHTAQCLDNRVDSLQGLAELATRAPLDAGRVDDLVDTLPAIDDCTSGAWVPYPADPEQAARAAEIHRGLTQLRRDRLADQRAGLDEGARAVVQEARDLGEPYLLARALAEHARVLTKAEDALPLLDEALELALAGGFDRLGAEVVNNVLLTAPHEPNASWRELGHLVAMARALVQRSGGGEVLLGNLALNEGRILRQAGRFEEAMVCDQRAEAHYAQAGFREGVAKARVNQAVTIIKQGRFAEAIPRLRATTEELEHASGMASPLAFQALNILSAGLIFAGHNREAFETAAEAHRRAQELYSPYSNTLRRSLMTYVVSALNVGETELGLTLIESLRALPNASDVETTTIDLLELDFLQVQLRHEDALQRATLLRAELGPDADAVARAQIELAMAIIAFVRGQLTAVHATLASPQVLRGLDTEAGLESVGMLTVLLAVLSEAPPPPGTDWRALLTEEPVMPINRQLREVIDAVETADDPIPTVRRTRDALAAAYNDRDVNVQLLDAWLAARGHGSP